MKIPLAGAELFHADRQTDGQTDGQMDRHDEAKSRFSKFCLSVYKRNVYIYCAENIVSCTNIAFIDAGV